MICERYFSFIAIASIGFLKWFTIDFLHFNSCILPSIIRHILLHRGIRGMIHGMTWPWFGHSSLNHNENMPYPVWKCLPYRSPHPLNCFKQQKPTGTRWNHLSTGTWFVFWSRSLVDKADHTYEVELTKKKSSIRILEHLEHKTHTLTQNIQAKNTPEKICGHSGWPNRRTSCLLNSNRAYSNHELLEI